uniref:Signal peptide protease n=1 Tax=Schistosoma japonicum TaxID=6182 RepID=C1L5G2_SCHJA|nr:Signal peptide protease [Schistosoma japonicum]
MNINEIKNVSDTNGTITNLEFNLDSIITNFALFLLAVVPIYIGSFRSTISKMSAKENSVELISGKDASLFPFIASAALFGIYIVFKFIPIQYINYVMKIYFSFMGVCAMSRVLSPIFRPYMPKFIKNMRFKFEFSRSLERSEGSESDWNLLDNVDFSIESKDFIGTGLGIFLGTWYFFSGHWIANNCIAVTVAILAIEFIRLNKFVNGILLLCGLFVYDIFWVFGTGIMMAVAKNLDIPIKVTFPRDFLSNGLFGKQLALLGLGDIVIPGIFIAMLLRFDTRLGRKNSYTYFYSGYIAYIVAIIMTFVMMHVFKHAQPALLYLVPACLGAPLLIAFVNKDLGAMFKYEDIPEIKVQSQEIKAPDESKKDN